MCFTCFLRKDDKTLPRNKRCSDVALPYFLNLSTHHLNFYYNCLPTHNSKSSLQGLWRLCNFAMHCIQSTLTISAVFNNFCFEHFQSYYLGGLILLDMKKCLCNLKTVTVRRHSIIESQTCLYSFYINFSMMAKKKKKRQRGRNNMTVVSIFLFMK